MCQSGLLLDLHFDNFVKSLPVVARCIPPTGKLKQLVCQGAVVKLNRERERNKALKYICWGGWARGENIKR